MSQIDCTVCKHFNNIFGCMKGFETFTDKCMLFTPKQIRVKMVDYPIGYKG